MPFAVTPGGATRVQKTFPLPLRLGSGQSAAVAAARMLSSWRFRHPPYFCITVPSRVVSICLVSLLESRPARPVSSSTLRELEREFVFSETREKEAAGVRAESVAFDLSTNVIGLGLALRSLTSGVFPFFGGRRFKFVPRSALSWFVLRVLQHV